MNNAAKRGFFIENSPFSFPDASFPPKIRRFRFRTPLSPFIEALKDLKL